MHNFFLIIAKKQGASAYEENLCTIELLRTLCECCTVARTEERLHKGCEIRRLLDLPFLQDPVILEGLGPLLSLQ